MSGHPAKGLRGVLGANCRRALREAISSSCGEWSAETVAHVSACCDCRARVHASRRLSLWLASSPKPDVPAALAGCAGEVLIAAYEEFNERVETGPLGQWMSAAKVAIPEVESACADTVVGERARLAGLLVTEPPVLESAVWTQLRRSILDTVAQETAVQEAAVQEAAAPVTEVGGTSATSEASGIRSTVLGWRVLFAGAAATIAIGFFVMVSSPEGIHGGGDLQRIAILDLGRAPDMDFAVARYGLRR